VLGELDIIPHNNIVISLLTSLSKEESLKRSRENVRKSLKDPTITYMSIVC
jgi:hypothetical protein